MKKEKIIVEGKTKIKYGDVEITDDGKPFSTNVKINGKDLSDLGNLQSFKYEVTVVKNIKNGIEPGKAKLTIEYYPEHVLVKKDDKES